MKRQILFYSLLGALLLLGCEFTPKIYDPACGEGYYILTPPAGDAPRFNGADIFGVRPRAPFLFTAAVTGIRPMQISVEGLPQGLSLDANGTISGVIADPTPCTYTIQLTAQNSKGKATRAMDIVVGEEICLTPPMGWSSWISMKKTVSQAKIMNNARRIKELGLDNYGYQYVNIDDAWQGNVRGGAYNAIQPDLVKFPDMKGLADTIHSMGMKFGIYSTPWVSSYAGYIGGSSNTPDGAWDKSMLIDFTDRSIEGLKSKMGKYRLDENDAKQWAAWGVDYMKYDWNPNDSLSIATMANALRHSGRDITFSISNTCPLSQAALCREQVQVFRTGGDIKARWSKEGHHINLCDNWNMHIDWIEQGNATAPGHIADPDFLMLGLQLYCSEDSLTADELYHHVSSYALLAAPLLVSCDMTTLPAFEISLLTNTEIIDIDQDRLALPAKRCIVREGIEVLVKELANGDKAIGIFNFNDEATTTTVKWDELELKGKQQLRDVWRQRNIGSFYNQFTANIRPHGCIVVRATAAK